jgi:hypothetical protein
LPEKRVLNIKIKITKRRVRLWEIINLVNLSEIKSTKRLGYGREWYSTSFFGRTSKDRA